jgi:hypothetical protein
MTADAMLLFGTLGAATITGLFTVAVAMVKGKNQLRDDHAQVQKTLERIDQRSERMEDRLDGHLQWHAEHE